MAARISVLAVVLVLSAAPALAIDFSATKLAGYEPDDLGRLTVTTDPVKDPTLDINWPLLGGVNDVPLPTQGRYVARLRWTNENLGTTPKKVEVGHYWNNFNFDFTDTYFLYVDVYVADESALATDIGLYDQHWPYPFTWIGTDFEYLMKPGEWRSIPFYVGGVNVPDLNHIEALVFDHLAGISGTIYLDNLRISAPVSGECHCARRVVFSGYTWCVLQSNWKMGAGPNYFTDDQNDIWVDANGLHLSIVKKDPNWYCSEVIATKNLGYGTYIYTVDANTDLLDPNVIVGLFVYDVCDGGYHEIDVELTRWGDSADINNAQFVVQPFDPCLPLESRDRFNINYSMTLVTHEFTWNPNVVAFRSYYGDYSPNPPAEAMIRSWSYTGPNVPRPAKDNPRINFYLTKGDPPQNGQNAHITIKSFRYLPLGDLDNDGDVDLQDFALFSGKWLWDVE